LQAEIAARRGAEKHARAALSLARYDLAGDRGGDPASSSFSHAHLRGFEGVAELYVGDPAQAHDYFARSAEALRAPRERVQRAIVATDQALARIRLDEPQAAAHLLHGCIDAAPTTGCRVAAIRLHRARRELRRNQSRSTRVCSSRVAGRCTKGDASGRPTCFPSLPPCWRSRDRRHTKPCSAADSR
jgi:hypothetical protein